MTIRPFALAALLLLMPACRAETAGGAAQARCDLRQPEQESGRPQSGLKIVPLEIRTASNNSHMFQIEVAATEDEQAKGMMYRNSVGPNEGMVFPFRPPRPAGFWMKNTRIPLDLIFVRADGTIARIARQAVPYCLDTVGVGEPVAAVLEIAGGRSGELGISEGDRVSWPAAR